MRIIMMMIWKSDSGKEINRNDSGEEINRDPFIFYSDQPFKSDGERMYLV